MNRREKTATEFSEESEITFNCRNPVFQAVGEAQCSL